MKLLAIETSCDDTGLAVLEVTESAGKPVFSVLTSELSSQTIHTNYGGVFPMMAKREHVTNFPILLEKIFSGPGTDPGSVHVSSDQETQISDMLSHEPELATSLIAYVRAHTKPDIDAITVTVGPGLEPALWVGINAAKTLAILWDLPLVPVNHMEGHILSVLFLGDQATGIQPIADVAFPAIALLVSGGHTELVLVRDWMEYELIGQTRDDAAGEAFDKVARLMGLPYPGGPEISRLAASAEGESEEIELPRPMLHSDDYDFSFSGLKTAVRYLVQRMPQPLDDQTKAQVANEFQQAVIDVLATKTMKALEAYGAQTLIVGGGVSGNQELRTQLTEKASELLDESRILFPKRELSTDNAIMIGIAGYFRFKAGNLPEPETLRAIGSLEL